jgi:hypothetical protein
MSFENLIPHARSKFREKESSKLFAIDHKKGYLQNARFSTHSGDIDAAAQ